jgi:hypothetical protein
MLSVKKIRQGILFLILAMVAGMVAIGTYTLEPPISLATPPQTLPQPQIYLYDSRELWGFL